MIQIEREKLEKVLDALENDTYPEAKYGINTAIAIIKDVLAQKDSEPVATVDNNSQKWAGMDGAIAFHLIERHADGWNDIRKMMEEWLSANTPQRHEQEPVAWVWVNNKGWLNYGETPHDMFKSSPLYTHPPQPEQRKYPDCKCPTENPCLKGLAHEQEPSIQDRLNNALQSLDFYRRRIYALQEWHGKMRDPERTIVCDIIVNGHTLDPAGDRYTHSPQPKQEPVAWLPTDRNPLTVEELKIIWQNLDPCDIVCRGVIRALVRAVESAHGIKENT